MADKFYKMIEAKDYRASPADLTSDYSNELSSLTHIISLTEMAISGDYESEHASYFAKYIDGSAIKNIKNLPLYQQRYTPKDNPHLYNDQTRPKICSFNTIVRLFNYRPDDTTLEELKMWTDELYYALTNSTIYDKRYLRKI